MVDLLVIRPADAYETACAWKIAIEAETEPTAIILTRQGVKNCTHATYDDVIKGAYIVGHEEDELEGIIIAAGSEVSLALEGQKKLFAMGHKGVRVVSMPCTELFDAQNAEYKESVLPDRIRARMAVERADVCVIMIDATEGFTEQDSKVAGIAHDLGKACIIAVNKWDAVEKDGHTMDKERKKLMNDFSFMSYAPIIFISAKTGQRLDRLYELIKFVNEQNSMRISTGKLNDVLAAATARVQPPTDKGKRLKIYYMTQASTRPPTFVCFVNSKDLFHYSYQRYIDNQIREVFGLEGTPTRYVVREREKNGKKDYK